MSGSYKNRELSSSLKERFVDGDKLTVEDIVNEYFTPTSTYTYLLAAKKVRGVLNSLKRWFRHEHRLWFGNIDDSGHYGLFTTEEEVRYGMLRYYKFVKGIIINANILTQNAREKGLLPANVKRERMLVATITEDNDEKKEGKRHGHR